MFTIRDKRTVCCALWCVFVFVCASWRGYAAVPIDEIIAVVNGDVVMASELDSRIERVRQEITQRGGQMPPPTVLRRQVLERLVLQKIQIQIAKRTGVEVTEDTINQAINNIASQNKLSPPEFRGILEREGYDFEQFRDEIRNEILISKLRKQQVENRIHVTDKEIDDYLSTREQQGEGEIEYNIGHILIAIPESASQDEYAAAKVKAEDALLKLRQGEEFERLAFTMSDGQQAAEGGDLGWLAAKDLPSLFTDVVVTMEQGQISDVISSPGGFHIIKLKGTNRSEKHMIVQTQARHILIKPNELIPPEEAKRRLATLKFRIEGGDDFGELARSHSDDRESAAKGGDLGWVNPGDLVPQFEQVMNETEPGQISEPFETQFGWHILQVQERRNHDGTNEVRRAKAREAIRKRKVDEEGQAWLRKLRDEAYVEYRR